jgi:hypothetical protein
MTRKQQKEVNRRTIRKLVLRMKQSAIKPIKKD